MKHVLQILLALYLAMGLGGLTPDTIADLVQPGDCCTDCSEPDCPDEEGEGCPPQCSDCMCPSYVSAMMQPGAMPLLQIPTVQAEHPWFSPGEHRPPMPSGIFRPPRQLA